MNRASVVIPTKNRCAQLLRTLATVYQQSVPVEVLVMDDGSSDETEERVRIEFPQVTYIRHTISRGPVYVRNRAVEMASCPIVFTLDDDCELPFTDTFAQTLESFDEPCICAVTIPFINVLNEQTVRISAPSKEGTFIGFDFYGGMVAFRRDAYLQVGGYREELVIAVEESDLAIRLMDAGYLIRLGTSNPIHHMESRIRDSDHRIEYGTRNNVLYAWNNIPALHVPLFLPGTTCKCLVSCLKKGRFMCGLRGLGKAVRSVLQNPQRRPVKRETFVLSRQLRRRTSIPLQEVRASFQNLCAPPAPQRAVQSSRSSSSTIAV